MNADIVITRQTQCSFGIDYLPLKQTRSVQCLLAAAFLSTSVVDYVYSNGIQAVITYNVTTYSRYKKPCKSPLCPMYIAHL